MSSKLLLGIDVGTGGTRAVLIDDAGAVVASCTAEHVGFASPETGWAEQDPRDWWRATCEAVKQVMATSGTKPSDIAAVGFSGQMHGAVLLDVSKRRWSTEMVHTAGLDPTCLPPLFESPDVCATISEAGAAATGLHK